MNSPRGKHKQLTDDSKAWNSTSAGLHLIYYVDDLIFNSGNVRSHTSSSVEKETNTDVLSSTDQGGRFGFPDFSFAGYRANKLFG